ncbi:MAG TPA: serine/threonine protein kinase, partial [Planctomycetota bacterium]|nr:serine/threonine protein kinase [Planctomycetota bacterium]
AARDLAAELNTRAGRDPRVHLHLSLHAGAVSVLGDRLTGGPLLEVSRWVSEQEGLHASPELLADLD